MVRFKVVMETIDPNAPAFRKQILLDVREKLNGGALTARTRSPS